MKYLITGNAGSGKSAVIEELRKRGYTAYNTDDFADVTRLEDLNCRPANPPEPVDWNKYGWNWQAASLKKLLASEETVFVAAITSNQQQFYDLFDLIFVLTLGKKELAHRIKTRNTNEYGKHPKEFKEILTDHDEFQQSIIEGAGSKAVLIDADQPLTEVVDDILSYIK